MTNASLANRGHTVAPMWNALRARTLRSTRSSPGSRRGSWVYGDNRPVHMPDYWKVAPCLAAAAIATAVALDSGLTVLERVGAVVLGSIVVAGLLVQVGFALRESKSMVGFAGALLSWLGAAGVLAWVVYVVG